MPWAVNQLRLTAFPTPSAVIRTPEWWPQVTGQPADQTAHNAKQGVFEAAGAFADGVLTLRVQPLRIDWLYTPPMPEGLPAFREVLGPWATAVDQFTPAVERWLALEDCPDLVRLAVGSVLLDPVESREVGYRQLGRFLPAIQLDENSSDFSYQINRPRSSAIIGDLKVNRVSKWSVGKFQAFVASDTGITFADKSFACRLETDVNSDPEYGRLLPKAELPTVFREFIGLTSELAERGDIP
jgi:hypothetical protein